MGAYQPHTIDPRNLLIGISSIELNGMDLGALANAGLEVTTVIKDRYVGYPTQRMESITEAVSGIVSFVAEEIGSNSILILLQGIFNSTNPVYDIAMYAPFAIDNSNLKLVAKAQVLPTMTINWQDEWCSLTFKFECVGTNINTLITRSIEVGIKRAATTIDKNNLSVGLPKILIDGLSVGSLQSVSLNLEGTVKRQERGYPRCTESIIYTSTPYSIDIVAEEHIITGVDCNVKMQQQLVNGTAIQIEFPHCKIPEDLGVNTTTNWLGYKQKILPFGDISPIISKVG